MNKILMLLITPLVLTSFDTDDVKQLGYSMLKGAVLASVAPWGRIIKLLS